MRWKIEKDITPRYFSIEFGKIRCYNNITQAHYVISESFYVLFQLFIKTGSSLIVTFFYIKSNFDLKVDFSSAFSLVAPRKKINRNTANQFL